MEKLWQLSANDLASGIREKKFSAREVVFQFLNESLQNPELNAITVEFPEEALSAADAADEAIAAGQTLGPLHGVPVTIEKTLTLRARQHPTEFPPSKA